MMTLRAEPDPGGALGDCSYQPALLLPPLRAPLPIPGRASVSPGLPPGSLALFSLACSTHGASLQDIRARSAAWKTEGVCSTKAGSQPGNVRKNRYKDVLPYDQTRVILSLLQEEGHDDYINGNFIRGVDGSQAYIATQGPLPHTLLDFWRMVWEFGVKVILMACRETELGRKKCERYWAQEQEPLAIGLFCITLTKETWLNADTMVRTLQVTLQKESRSVHQLQFLSWPDRGVPSNPDHVLALVEEARRLQGSGPGPLCVHCRLRENRRPVHRGLREAVAPDADCPASLQPLRPGAGDAEAAARGCADRGAVQPRVPHGGSDVLRRAPEGQSPLREPQGESRPTLRRCPLPQNSLGPPGHAAPSRRGPQVLGSTAHSSSLCKFSKVSPFLALETPAPFWPVSSPNTC
ncbi:tyrosine-protein phosphatase non-receptor type 18 isoform X3 [Dasypus novemcinctus]|uniref:tyrosine-protein phosphatase non-receptor type 18 isoform X3 n=1 Tax=Dasypus novemcinctus TaxID=9361 RepID=UPI00265DA7ED|nr:tyrosine-protein phosphatase non-receptor type 18 isoform X3 [Dasypus novemcinctus]